MPTDESPPAATPSEQQQEAAPDSGLARLQLTGISKRFGAVRAIRNADLTVRAGQVHALVGENGAGKSTMIKIISGVESADTGRIEFEGAEVSISSTTDAMALGIATVYQEPQLFAELTVSENIFTGREIRKGGRVDWAAQNDRVVELLELLGLPGKYATVPVGTLSIAEQQQVSIAKALAGNAKVLILDEPSAILTDAEIEVLFAVVRRLTASGVSVIYISHRLDELFRIAQQVTVMRDGQTIGTYPIEELSVRQIAELMVGGILSDDRPERVVPDGEPALVLSGLSRTGKFHDVDVAVKRGEIVGLYGLVGSGVSEIAACIYGMDRATSGQILLNGKPISPAVPAARAEAGHRAAAGEPQAGGHVLVPVDRLQHLGRAPEPAVQVRDLRRPGPGEDGRQGPDQAARGEDAQRAAGDRRDVRRQRPEGRAGTATGRAAGGAGAGRADPGGRRRRQGGDPPDHHRTGREWFRGAGGDVRSGRGAADFRPAAGGSRWHHHGRVRPGGHPGRCAGRRGRCGRRGRERGMSTTAESAARRRFTGARTAGRQPAKPVSGCCRRRSPARNSC